MKKPEKYWTYQAGLIPEVKDLPPGVFSGDEKAWSSLSPGMRREIYRQAMKRTEANKNPRRKSRKKRARRPAKRGARRRITRARRNPSPIAFSPRGRGAQSPPVCPGCGLANPSDAHLLSCIKGKGKWPGTRRKNVQITFGKRNPKSKPSLFGHGNRHLMRPAHGGWLIAAKELLPRGKSKMRYLSLMGGFTAHRMYAEPFTSKYGAEHKARSIVKMLPKQIEFIKVIRA